jgi:hypothetical protein
MSRLRPAPVRVREVTIVKAQAFDLLKAGQFLPRKKAAEAMRLARRFGK